jgi:murein DD-endopeptidase MepM/ murein hydrolase activator NlpD
LRHAFWLLGVLGSSASPLLAAPAKHPVHTRSLEPDPAIAAEPISEVRSAETPPSALPSEWLPSRGSECIKSGPNRGFCNGPRRVPKPRGEPAALARRLGLGVRTTCSLLLFHPPRDSWIEAARSAGAAATWLYPVEQSRLLRGLGDPTAALKRRTAQLKHKQKAGSHQRHAHEGLDIGAREGAPIRAAQNGLVVYSDNGLTGYGNALLVVHKDGSIALYGHCRATYVFAGQQVERGQIIGEVGHTGYARGAHLHFEYRVRGEARDPTALFAPHS